MKCPSCGETGSAVGAITLESLLTSSALGSMSGGPYRFCAAKACGTVYYAEDGPETFARADLTVRVGVKEEQAPRPICYCFGHTMEAVEEEVRATGSSGIPDSIRANIKSGCDCVTKNPQGSCCLGAVTKYVTETVARYAS